MIEAGASAALGRFITLRDAYGNTYTYAGLGALRNRYPASSLRGVQVSQDLLSLPAQDPQPAVHPTSLVIRRD